MRVTAKISSNYKIKPYVFISTTSKIFYHHKTQHVPATATGAAHRGR